METNPFRAQRTGQPRSSRAAAGIQPPAPSPERSRAGLAGALGRWAEEQSAGKNAWIRAPLLLLLGWIFLRYLGNPFHSSIFGGINLAFHEIGHVLFGFPGNEFLMFAGGTILEVAIPVIAAVLLARQGDAFGVAVGGFWFGTALHGVSVYLGDTRAQMFGRVALGDYDGPDDWTYILGRFGLIRQDELISAWMRGGALLGMAGALAYGAWILWLMARPKSGAVAGSDGEEARLADFVAADKARRGG